MSQKVSRPPNLKQLEQEIIACRKCPRLAQWREQIGELKRKAYRNETYWAKPVPGFGDPNAIVLVVGLAPGAHGSNRTGRMFTGDDSGNFLYPALWRAGFANQPEGLTVGDGLQLNRVWITAVCRCAPPDNKPTKDEIVNCRFYLKSEISLLLSVRGIVAFGKIAYDEICRVFDLSRARENYLHFTHGGLIESNENQPWVLASYHPSRQNTQTGRLTAQMFDQIWLKVNQLLLD
ncbi:MAG: uracil-DNA glycosylase [Chloroflexi bacterium]|nr:MAG: uracil-DNA glycosylase [Chloroflexota bacterium]